MGCASVFIRVPADCFRKLFFLFGKGPVGALAGWHFVAAFRVAFGMDDTALGSGGDFGRILPAAFGVGGIGAAVLYHHRYQEEKNLTRQPKPLGQWLQGYTAEGLFPNL